ncbi:DNA/RNA non-specific endonuclease [Rivularia sp. PCC 7116]|nr:DNA/RNA non-specific endonuclease [Rivularia sp. PCC 7116]
MKRQGLSQQQNKSQNNIHSSSGWLQRAAVRELPGKEVESAVVGESGLNLSFVKVPVHGGGLPVVQRKFTIGAAGDRYEQEADRVASQVVQRKNAPDTSLMTQEPLSHRLEASEEEAKLAKPEISLLQREIALAQIQGEEMREELQMKPMVQRRADGGEASGDLTSGINRTRVSATPAVQLQRMADNHSAQQQQPIQKKENNTGLPDNLKTGIENLSGYSMEDVKVHYNSEKPAQLQAHAYAQGTVIYLGPGREKHLPHETWHVVQQKQGRVKPTIQMLGEVKVNDDVGLEKEADVMGATAINMKPKDNQSKSVANSVAQKKGTGLHGFGIANNRPEAIWPRKLKEMMFKTDQEKKTTQKIIQRKIEEVRYNPDENVNTINGIISKTKIQAIKGNQSYNLWDVVSLKEGPDIKNKDGYNTQDRAKQATGKIVSAPGVRGRSVEPYGKIRELGKFERKALSGYLPEGAIDTGHLLADKFFDTEKKNIAYNGGNLAPQDKKFNRQAYQALVENVDLSSKPRLTVTLNYPADYKVSLQTLVDYNVLEKKDSSKIDLIDVGLDQELTIPARLPSEWKAALEPTEKHKITPPTDKIAGNSAANGTNPEYWHTENPFGWQIKETTYGYTASFVQGHPLLSLKGEIAPVERIIEFIGLDMTPTQVEEHKQILKYVEEGRKRAQTEYKAIASQIEVERSNIAVQHAPETQGIGVQSAPTTYEKGVQNTTERKDASTNAQGPTMIDKSTETDMNLAATLLPELLERGIEDLEDQKEKETLKRLIGKVINNTENVNVEPKEPTPKRPRQEDPTPSVPSHI